MSFCKPSTAKRKNTLTALNSFFFSLFSCYQFLPDEQKFGVYVTWRRLANKLAFDNPKRDVLPRVAWPIRYWLFRPLDKRSSTLRQSVNPIGLQRVLANFISGAVTYLLSLFGALGQGVST